MMNLKQSNKQNKVLVIGSFMMDFVVKMPRFPSEGETIIGHNFNRFPGGKGANQAVAAARLGANVTISGKLGMDDFGDVILEAINNEKINTRFISHDRLSHTGIGYVLLDQEGNNRIVVIPGANLKYQQNDLKQLEDYFKKVDIILCQLEMDIDIIEKAINLADKFKVPLILNPAPAQQLSNELYSKVTYITPNKSEAEILTGVSIKNLDDVKKAIDILLDKGAKNIVITLGDKGSLIAEGSDIKYIRGYKMKPIDSVAAGDAFNGALAFKLASGSTLEEAAKFANAAGALTVTKQGAIPSLPYLKEVKDFLKKQNQISQKL